MAIIGKNIVLGFGDVGIQSRLKGKNGNQSSTTACIEFYQLNSPDVEAHLDNKDKTIIPINIISDVHGLEVLHNVITQLLEEARKRNQCVPDQ